MTWKWRKACGLKKKEYNLLKTVSLKMKHLTANEWFKTGLSHISWFFDLALSLSVSLGFLDSSGQYSPSSFKGEKKKCNVNPKGGNAKPALKWWLRLEEAWTWQKRDRRAPPSPSPARHSLLAWYYLGLTCVRRLLPSYFPLVRGSVRLGCFKSWGSSLTKITIHWAKATSAQKHSVTSWEQPYPFTEKGFKPDTGPSPLVASLSVIVCLQL